MTAALLTLIDTKPANVTGFATPNRALYVIFPSMALLTVGLALLAAGPSAPVILERKFPANEKLTYQVRSAMTAEQRTIQLFTWRP